MEYSKITLEILYSNILGVKAILLICLVALLQLQMAELLEERGQQLGMLNNLPHRVLGFLYAAKIICPWRDDYEFNYISEWSIINYEQRMLEGSTRPVMSFEAILNSKLNPDQKWQLMAGLCKQIERKQRTK